MTAQQMNNTDARLSSLETSVVTLTEGMRTLSIDLRSLSDTVSKSHRWDWAAIWGGMGVLLTMDQPDLHAA
jgi:hypothetical protein